LRRILFLQMKLSGNRCGSNKMNKKIEENEWGGIPYTASQVSSDILPNLPSSYNQLGINIAKILG